MRDLHSPSQHFALAESLDFELDSDSGRPTTLRLSSKRSQRAATQSPSALLIARPCSAAAVFSTRSDVRSPVSKRYKHQLCYEEACFASLLQSFTKSKPQAQQVAKADDKPQSGESVALGWGKHLLCGALSAVVSRTTMAPLERIKLEIVLHKRQDTMFEVALGVFDQNGVQGFWKGNGLNILRTAPYKAVNFFSYDMYRKLLLRLSGNENKPNRAERFAAGALAGVTATVTCFPLDVLRTRVMGPTGHAYGGVINTFRQLVQKEGLGSLYVGLLPAVISMAPAGAVFYGVYDLLKEHTLRPVRVANGRQPGDLSGGEQLGPLHMLLFGALSGASAEAVVYPMEVIRRRMQMKAASAGMQAVSRSAQQQAKTNAFKTLSATIRSLAAEEGVRGFYSGILPNMLQVLPNAALSYFAYETFKRLLEVPD